MARNALDTKEVKYFLSTLGYYSCQLIDGKKQDPTFFWGYRTRAIVTKEDICLVEKTLPNNVTDADAAYSLIRAPKRRFRFKKGAIFIADKAYDIRELYALYQAGVAIAFFQPSTMDGTSSSMFEKNKFFRILINEKARKETVLNPIFW